MKVDSVTAVNAEVIISALIKILLRGLRLLL